MRFSEETRNRVLEAARHLKYERRAAKGIGVIHCIGSHDPESEPWLNWITPMLNSIHLEAAVDDTLVSILAFHDKTRRSLLSGGEDPAIFRRRKIDGVILSGRLDNDLVERLDRIRMPYVMMNVADSFSRPEDVVSFDEIFTGVIGTRHLLEKGHRRIAYLNIGYAEKHYSGPQRRLGYEQVMGEAGLTPEFLDCPTADHLPKPLESLIQQKERPTAIFVYDETTALHCLRVLQQHKIRLEELELMVPSWRQDDVAIALGMTMVRLPAAQLGRLAYQMLTNRIENGRPEPAVSLRGNVVVTAQD